jgi:hypothetical protein
MALLGLASPTTPRLMVPQQTHHSDDDNCKKVSWKEELHPTCNNLHQFHLVEFHGGCDVLFLGHGDWLFAWQFHNLGTQDGGEPALLQEESNSSTLSSFAFKTLRSGKLFDNNVELDKMGQARREAVIMEKLTPFHRVVDTCGCCGISIQAERMNCSMLGLCGKANTLLLRLRWRGNQPI